MLFKKEQKNYLIKVKIKLKLYLQLLFELRISFFIFKYVPFLTMVLLAFLIPIKTKPTGFFLVPPLGPAIQLLIQKY